MKIIDIPQEILNTMDSLERARCVTKATQAVLEISGSKSTLIALGENEINRKEIYTVLVGIICELIEEAEQELDEYSARPKP